MALADVGARDAHLGAQRLAGAGSSRASSCRARRGRGGSPCAMPTSARPRPVLPAVASTIVPPGFRRPSRSAASIIDSADAVLDRAARVCRFELEEQPARAGVEARDLDERRLADQVEDARRRHADVLLRAGRTHIEGSARPDKAAPHLSRRERSRRRSRPGEGLRPVRRRRPLPWRRTPHPVAPHGTTRPLPQERRARFGPAGAPLIMENSP